MTLCGPTARVSEVSPPTRSWWKNRAHLKGGEKTRITDGPLELRKGLFREDGLPTLSNQKAVFRISNLAF